MKAAHRRRARRELAELAAALCEAGNAECSSAIPEVLGQRVHLLVDCGPRVVDGTPGESFGMHAVWTLHRLLGECESVRLDVCSVNGLPGVRASRGGDVVAVIALSGRVGDARDVWVVADPAKLGHWQ